MRDITFGAAKIGDIQMLFILPPVNYNGFQYLNPESNLFPHFPLKCVSRSLASLQPPAW
jgi:hypothetical protein